METNSKNKSSVTRGILCFLSISIALASLMVGGMYLIVG